MDGLTPEENLLSEILREAIDCAAGALECGDLPPLSSGRTSGGNSWILRTQASAGESGEQAPGLQTAIAQSLCGNSTRGSFRFSIRTPRRVTAKYGQPKGCGCECSG
jgi:hypothetical protein